MVMDEVGELGLHPAHSMPLFPLGEVDGKRYLSSAISDMYPLAAMAARTGGGGDGDAAEMGPPFGVMATGLKPFGEYGCIIYGRSDATINRHGLCMGTSEIYSAAEALPEVLDSMVGGPRNIWASGGAICRCSWCCVRAWI